MTDRLSDLIDCHTADIYKSGRLAASLERHHDRIEFRYHPDYLARPGEPVATTLPVISDPILTAAGAVPAFFAGLLPEGRRLTAIRRAVKTSADDDFTLVLAVGADTIGDVQVVPAGTAAALPTPHTAGEWSDLDFAELYERSIGVDPELAAIAGVQEKVSGRMIAFPTAEGRSILKLNPPEFPFVVENEAFFLSAARQAGIPCAESRIVRDRAGASGLLVTRFDRDQASMIAQEDGCQVLGRYPADKYRVGSAEVINALAAVTGAPTVAAYELLRIVLFSYLSGNGDLHAKNLSVYRPGDEWRVTPAYDLVSTYFYGDYTLALSIGDGRRNKDLSRQAIYEFADSIGVSRRAAARLVDDQLEASKKWMEGIDTLPFDERRTGKFFKFVQHPHRLLGP